MNTEQLIGTWVRPEIREISAYHVPDPGGLIKLDAMENPYSWPPELVDEWLAALRDVPVNRYPDPGAAHLKSCLRAVMNIPADMDILLGNGSDEIIQMLALALGGPGRKVLSPEPTFVMYRMIAAFAGLEYVGVPLTDRFGLDEAATLAAIEEHRPAVVYLAFPNNPTGNLFDERAMERVIASAPGLVVVDEAYHAFAERTFIDRLADFPNLLVMRTVSKLGLAGLRLGFVAGPRPWLREIDKVRLPYNINVLTQVSGEFALRHSDVFDRQTALIREERSRVWAVMDAMAGVEPFPSAANFILFRAEGVAAEEVFERIREDGVLIKNLAGAGGPLRDCLRVTVGTPEENDAFLAALRRAIV